MREPKEERIDRLRAELVRAKEKSSQWQARVRDLERRITEQENFAIIYAVRGIAAAPEDLRALLDRLQAAQKPPQTNLTDEEEN